MAILNMAAKRSIIIKVSAVVFSRKSVPKSYEIWLFVFKYDIRQRVILLTAITIVPVLRHGTYTDSSPYLIRLNFAHNIKNAVLYLLYAQK